MKKKIAFIGKNLGKREKPIITVWTPLNKDKIKKLQLKLNPLKKFPDACLETCGDKHHKQGCYISLKKNKNVAHSEEIHAIIDFDKKNQIVGIDLEGFSW